MEEQIDSDLEIPEQGMPRIDAVKSKLFDFIKSKNEENQQENVELNSKFKRREMIVGGELQKKFTKVDGFKEIPVKVQMLSTEIGKYPDLAKINDLTLFKSTYKAPFYREKKKKKKSKEVRKSQRQSIRDYLDAIQQITLSTKDIISENKIHLLNLSYTLRQTQSEDMKLRILDEIARFKETKKIVSRTVTNYSDLTSIEVCQEVALSDPSTVEELLAFSSNELFNTWFVLIAKTKNFGMFYNSVITTLGRKIFLMQYQPDFSINKIILEVLTQLEQGEQILCFVNDFAIKETPKNAVVSTMQINNDYDNSDAETKSFAPPFGFADLLTYSKLNKFSCSLGFSSVEYPVGFPDTIFNMGTFSKAVSYYPAFFLHNGTDLNPVRLLDLQMQVYDIFHIQYNGRPYSVYRLLDISKMIINENDKTCIYDNYEIDGQKLTLVLKEKENIPNDFSFLMRLPASNRFENRFDLLFVDELDCPASDTLLLSFNEGVIRVPVITNISFNGFLDKFSISKPDPSAISKFTKQDLESKPIITPKTNFFATVHKRNLPNQQRSPTEYKIQMTSHLYDSKITSFLIPAVSLVPGLIVAAIFKYTYNVQLLKFIRSKHSLLTLLDPGTYSQIPINFAKTETIYRPRQPQNYFLMSSLFVAIVNDISTLKHLFFMVEKNTNKLPFIFGNTTYSVALQVLCYIANVYSSQLSSLYAISKDVENNTGFLMSVIKKKELLPFQIEKTNLLITSLLKKIYSATSNGAGVIGSILASRGYHITQALKLLSTNDPTLDFKGLNFLFSLVVSGGNPDVPEFSTDITNALYSFHLILTEYLTMINNPAKHNVVIRPEQMSSKGIEEIVYKLLSMLLMFNPKFFIGSYSNKSYPSVKYLLSIARVVSIRSNVLSAYLDITAKQIRLGEIFNSFYIIIYREQEEVESIANDIIRFDKIIISQSQKPDSGPLSIINKSANFLNLLSSFSTENKNDTLKFLHMYQNVLENCRFVIAKILFILDYNADGQLAPGFDSTEDIRSIIKYINAEIKGGSLIEGLVKMLKELFKYTFPYKKQSKAWDKVLANIVTSVKSGENLSLYTLASDGKKKQKVEDIIRFDESEERERSNLFGGVRNINLQNIRTENVEEGKEDIIMQDIGVNEQGTEMLINEEGLQNISKVCGFSLENSRASTNRYNIFISKSDASSVVKGTNDYFNYSTFPSINKVNNIILEKSEDIQNDYNDKNSEELLLNTNLSKELAQENKNIKNDVNKKVFTSSLDNDGALPNSGMKESLTDDDDADDGISIKMPVKQKQDRPVSTDIKSTDLSSVNREELQKDLKKITPKIVIRNSVKQVSSEKRDLSKREVSKKVKKKAETSSERIGTHSAGEFVKSAFFSEFKEELRQELKNEKSVPTMTEKQNINTFVKKWADNAKKTVKLEGAMIKELKKHSGDSLVVSLLLPKLDETRSKEKFKNISILTNKDSANASLQVGKQLEVIDDKVEQEIEMNEDITSAFAFPFENDVIISNDLIQSNYDDIGKKAMSKEWKFISDAFPEVNNDSQYLKTLLRIITPDYILSNASPAFLFPPYGKDAYRFSGDYETIFLNNIKNMYAFFKMKGVEEGKLLEDHTPSGLAMASINLGFNIGSDKFIFYEFEEGNTNSYSVSTLDYKIQNRMFSQFEVVLGKTFNSLGVKRIPFFKDKPHIIVPIAHTLETSHPTLITDVVTIKVVLLKMAAQLHQMIRVFVIDPSTDRSTYIYRAIVASTYSSDQYAKIILVAKQFNIQLEMFMQSMIEYTFPVLIHYHPFIMNLAIIFSIICTQQSREMTYLVSMLHEFCLPAKERKQNNIKINVTRIKYFLDSNFNTLHNLISFNSGVWPYSKWGFYFTANFSNLMHKKKEPVNIIPAENLSIALIPLSINQPPSFTMINLNYESLIYGNTKLIEDGVIDNYWPSS